MVYRGAISINYIGTNPKIDHATGLVIPNEWEHEYLFKYNTQDQPFVQTQGEIYWLNIVGMYHETTQITNKFGWKTTYPSNGWNDDAVSSSLEAMQPGVIPPLDPFLSHPWYEMRHGKIGNTSPVTGLPYYGGLAGPHYDSNIHHSVGMAFSLTTESTAEPQHVFGWKTADPYQPAPDPTPGPGEDGWIDDAVSTNDPWLFASASTL